MEIITLSKSLTAKDEKIRLQGMVGDKEKEEEKQKLEIHIVCIQYYLEEGCLLVCSTVYQRFRDLGASTYDTLVNFCHTARCYNLKDRQLCTHW